MQRLRLLAWSGVVAMALSSSLTSVQAQTVRPEVAKPMQQASDLLKGGKAAAALAKVKEADAVANKNPCRAIADQPHAWLGCATHG